MGDVLRIVSAAALLAVLAAGCGGGAPQRSASHGVPPALARDWERQASAIAAAASAGDNCRALQHLAATLRGDVVAAQHKLPLRLRSPLVTGVSALADRITCAPVPTPKEPPKGPKHEPPPPKKHGRHGHHGEHDN